MKKLFFPVILLAVSFSFINSLSAQTQTPLRVGVFDIEMMVRAMPGYAKVDSLVNQFNVDSLGAEYNFYQDEFQRLDSTFKADSAKGKTKSVLDALLKQRQQVGLNIVYWQQIAQNKSQNKRAQLAQPLYESVANAYKKVLEAKKITLVLKPEAIEVGSSPTVLEDLFALVAKELKIPLPQGGQQAAAEEEPAPKANPAPSKPQSGAKPKPKQ